MKFRLTTAIASSLVLFGLLSAGPVFSQDKPYTDHMQCEKNSDGNKECKIDLWMTRGFRAFSQCQVCHGLDGSGSTIAPSLLDKLQDIDKDRFYDVVTHGYQGQIGVMPAWGENPNVMKYIDNLYAYLLARSDGELPAGKIKRYDR
ncbi:MAG: cytochrome c [Gammaproteobacteria bacterium]